MLGLDAQKLLHHGRVLAEVFGRRGHRAGVYPKPAGVPTGECLLQMVGREGRAMRRGKARGCSMNSDFNYMSARPFVWIVFLFWAAGIIGPESFGYGAAQGSRLFVVVFLFFVTGGVRGMQIKS